MSFRLRVLSLVAAVALVSTGATAWLTLRQASAQITETTSADQRVLASIVDTLVAYARSRNGWAGVESAVEQLAAQTGHRIRLTAESGAPVADSDALGGRPAPEPALVLDPRVPPTIMAHDQPPVTIRALAEHVLAYRAQAHRAACLAERGSPAKASVVSGRLELTVDEPDHPAALACQARPPASIAELYDMIKRFAPCELATELGACLEQRYAQVVSEFAPPTLRLQVGAVDTKPAGLAAGPIAAVAAAVLLVVVAGAWLLSRRVLHPIAALTAAATRLGAGDLGQRVPISGGDELAALARSFNQMAEALEASEARQRRLVADVAHELRTPLSNLRGYLEALQDGVMDADPALLQALHQEALLQQRIVDDLQDLALAEAGQLAYRRGPVDLRELVEACLVAHRPAAEAAGVHLTTAALPDPGPVVTADADRIRQAVGNIVANAIRATAPGGSVRLGIVDDPGWIGVRVSDTGVGIAPEDLPHVFDRFWRADTSRGRVGGGAGLGLAIARQILLDHGGGIDVESRVGRGTTFTLRLPR